MKVLMRKLLRKKELFAVIGVVLTHLSVASTSAASAQDDALDRLFTIRQVKVDETASRASEARRTALAKAELEAYGKLMRKLTQAEGRARLPDLSPPEIQAMISGIEVVDEQSSSRRYLATLDVRFEPGVVNSFLASHKVPHVLGTGRGILVLHAHSRGLVRTLWEYDAVIVDARAQVDWLNRIRQYVFPRGTMKERALVTVEEVFNSSEQVNSNAIASGYGVRSALMIKSDWDTASAILTFSYRSPDESVSGEGFVDDQANEQQALVAMYDSVLEAIDSGWRSRLLVDTGVGGELDVLVPSSNLADFSAVQDILEEVSLVGRVSIKEIGLPSSRLQFSYTGREDQLVLALHYAGLTLSEYGDDKLLELRRDEQK